MAQYIYTVQKDNVALAMRMDTCPAMHRSPSEVFHSLPNRITEPDAAKKYMEDNVLRCYPGAKVTLYLQCEEWVPTTHKCNKR